MLVELMDVHERGNGAFTKWLSPQFHCTFWFKGSSLVVKTPLQA